MYWKVSCRNPLVLAESSPDVKFTTVGTKMGTLIYRILQQCKRLHWT